VARQVSPSKGTGAPRAGRGSARIGPYWRARAVYALIRAVLGPRVSDNELARRWGIDARVFNDIKFGRIAVPRIDRLRTLAPVLGINEHFIYAVAAGAPWRRILAAARRGEAARALEVLVGTARKAQDALRVTQNQLVTDRARLAQVSSKLGLRDAALRALLEQLFVAVVAIDHAGCVVSTNSVARKLFGIAKTWEGPLTLALQKTVLIDLRGQPFDPPDLPIYRALYTNKPVARTFTIHRKGKAPQVVVSTASPIRDRRGKQVGVISILRSVSDLFDPKSPIPLGARR
jgi:PAS domain-containing protein